MYQKIILRQIYFWDFCYYVKNFFAIIHSVKLPCWLLHFHSFNIHSNFYSIVNAYSALMKILCLFTHFFSFFLSRGWEGWNFQLENYSIITIKSLLVWIFMTWFFASSVFISSPDWIFFLFASQSFWEVQRIFSAISFLLFLEIFSCFWLIKYRWHLEIWLIHVIHLDL